MNYDKLKISQDHDYLSHTHGNVTIEYDGQVIATMIAGFGPYGREIVQSLKQNQDLKEALEKLLLISTTIIETSASNSFAKAKSLAEKALSGKESRKEES